MCSVLTIIYLQVKQHTQMWTFHWTLFKNYYKSENRKEYIQLIKRVHMYFFSSSFCIHVTNSENFIENLSYRKRCYIHYKRGGLENVATPPWEQLWTSRPPGSHQILAIYSLLAFSCICQHLAQNRGGGSYILVSYSLALGCICQHLAQNEGIGPYMLALGLRHRSWSYTLAFGSKYWCWIVHAGVRL